MAREVHKNDDSFQQVVLQYSNDGGIAIRKFLFAAGGVRFTDQVLKSLETGNNGKRTTRCQEVEVRIGGK